MLRLEFVAVQIIAVDTVQNSGSCITGYLMKTRILIQNNVSTGDLNRGRRTESRLLFGSFCRSKKNKTVPFRELSIAWKACPCRGSTLRVLLLPCRKLSRLPCRLRRISLLLSQQSFAASRHFPGRRDAASYLYTQSVCAACFASKQKEAEAEISRFLLLWFYKSS